jgi:hypothetical protein
MKSPSTGRIWLDRNLGAKQRQEVNSSTNSAAYGDIYQWGRRNDDRHKSRGSATISTRLASITALDDRFIVNNETPDDWTTNRAVDDSAPTLPSAPSICPRKPAVGILRKLDKASAVFLKSLVSANSSALVGTLKPFGQMSSQVGYGLIET